MGFRANAVSKSVLKAIFEFQEPVALSFLAKIWAFFSFFHLLLVRFKSEVFKHLRKDVWAFDEEEYTESFRVGKLNAVGDLGYSGSTFFTTPSSKLLIKSLPRRFEYTFFQQDLLAPYVEHNESHPSSILVRITDFLYTPVPTLGSILGLAPPRHMVMENLLYGKLDDTWETYDLKPNDYFFPERDLAGGVLTTERVKERLIDEFPDKVRLTRLQFDTFRSQLSQDTALLCKYNAVDYSLFLVRYPASRPLSDIPPPLGAQDKSGDWRTGMTDSRGEWTYRVVVLDFFWAKHKLTPKVWTYTFGLFGRSTGHGDMTVTAEPEEYRRRFLKMIDTICIVEGDAGEQGGSSM
ncbi:SAICAR synthase-like protein [Atractiella rhizophila]|nr:SAICAR synthase-like protein [Atractiella rhizophila]